MRWKWEFLWFIHSSIHWRIGSWFCFHRIMTIFSASKDFESAVSKGFAFFPHFPLPSILFSLSYFCSPHMCLLSIRLCHESSLDKQWRLCSPSGASISRRTFLSTLRSLDFSLLLSIYQIVSKDDIRELDINLLFSFSLSITHRFYFISFLRVLL